MGWISHEEAAQRGAGVDMPAAPAPLAMPSGYALAGGGPANPSEIEAEPGGNRSRDLLAELGKKNGHST